MIAEKVLPADPSTGSGRIRYPLCVAGKRACPPEDVGGVWEYQRFLEAIDDPEHPEHDEYQEWIGGEFDPENFDLDEVNDRLRQPRRGRETDDYPLPKLEDRVLDRITAWSPGLSKKEIAFAESLAVRRDMATLLNYIQENHPPGTQSTGNLQLNAVREVCAQFTDPPKLERTIGDYHYQVRSEADVWPLFYLHMLAATGGLAAGGQARAWKLTPAGEALLNSSGPMQIGIVLSIWWHLVDWRIAYPVEGLRRGLAPDFRETVRARLLELKTSKIVAYEPICR